MFTKNLIQMTGNITKTPETRNAGETTVTHARLIHNEAIRKADGGIIERLVAVDLVIWGKRGQAFAQHITNKTPVYVEGRLQLDQWEQDGQPRSRLLIRVADWQFLAPKAELTTTTQAGTSTMPQRGRETATAAA